VSGSTRSDTGIENGAVAVAAPPSGVPEAVSATPASATVAQFHSVVITSTGREGSPWPPRTSAAVPRSTNAATAAAAPMPARAGRWARGPSRRPRSTVAIAPRSGRSGTSTTRWEMESDMAVAGG